MVDFQAVALTMTAINGSRWQVGGAAAMKKETMGVEVKEREREMVALPAHVKAW